MFNTKITAISWRGKGSYEVPPEILFLKELNINAAK